MSHNIAFKVISFDPPTKGRSSSFQKTYAFVEVKATLKEQRN